MKRKRFLAGVLLWAMAASAGAVGSLVDVTVYDRAERRTLPVYFHEGRHYVVGKPGNEYQVRVRNRTGGDILSVISVDGGNVVSGETAAWHQTGYILGPQQGFDVKGWRKSLERVAAFFFTEHPNSYAARIEQSPPQSEPAPGGREDSPFPAPAEAASSAGGPASARESAAARLIAPDGYRAGEAHSLGTGHGRSQTSRVSHASFERATERPEEVIAIHYDTFSNLVALGVIRTPRIASPFPGQFVPDPK